MKTMDIINQLQALRQELCDIEATKTPVGKSFRSISFIDQLIEALETEFQELEFQELE